MPHSIGTAVLPRGDFIAGRPTPLRQTVARPTSTSLSQKEAGKRIKLLTSSRGIPGLGGLIGGILGGIGGPLGGVIGGVINLFGGGNGQGNGKPLGVTTPDCGLFQVWDPALQRCVAGLGQFPGSDDPGTAIMGRYGAGMVPGAMAISRAVCLKGMQLGNDGICYNKSQIRNNQRMWPAGRKPLLTGGDMRAISVASRAGTRMEKATARLRKLGMMKTSRSGQTVAEIKHVAKLEAHIAASKH